MKLQAGSFEFDLTIPRIMGILNVTPDSFSDGGKFNSIDSALKQTDKMISDGADIIDIGAESTRPGARLVPTQAELSRLLPIIKSIKSNFNICISIDTNKPSVMRAVLDLGVDMINDVKGFTEPMALETVADYDAAICIMHMQGLPKTMQDNPTYKKLIPEIKSFLEGKARYAESLGIGKNRITIDPGFGFGKTPAQNYLLVKHCDLLAKNYPVLMGLSKKSSLGVILGDNDLDRTNASVVGALISIQNGASIVRVHNVRKTAEAIKIHRAFVR